MQAKALVRLTGIILSLCLLTTIAAKAQAGAGDLGSTESFNINDRPVEITAAGTYTITSNGVETGNAITVNLESKDAVANITIKGVNIGLKACPFDIQQGTVNLTLEGDNVLHAKGEFEDETHCAALQVSKNSQLVITEKSTGKLRATGGYYGAGIGGGFHYAVGSITIAGGTVEATGGSGGAGIGGGDGVYYGEAAGSITISGGTVVATGGSGGAGIGGGSLSSSGSITISGGTVEARGGNGGAGIGGGLVSSSGSITIEGGIVKATKGEGEYTVGIGYTFINSSTNYYINIKGGKVETDVIGYDGARINNNNDLTGTIEGGTIVCKSIFPTLSITGGSVCTDDNSVVNGKGMVVMKGLPNETEVTSIQINEEVYGSTDVFTDDKGQLYLYIPKGDPVPVSLTIDNQEYTLYVTLDDIITINTNASYDHSIHKNKSIKIDHNVTFIINTPDASVIDLTIEAGGKLLTEQPLEVKGKFTVLRTANEDKWITFCSPVPLKLNHSSWAAVSSDTDCLYLKSGFTTANDQEWTFKQSIEKDTPYLLGALLGTAAYELYAQDVTLPGRKKIDIETPSDFDNNLLFRTNTSLTEQELTNIYVLDYYEERQAIVLKDNYTLKPFEAYFVASPASPTPPATESQGEPGKVTSPELRAAPNDIIMPQKLTLKQPHSGKGSFTVKKEGQVAYGFALPEETVTLELKPNEEGGYSVVNSLIKVYETGDSSKGITLSGSGNTRTFTMPNAPVTIEVEFMKTLTIIPDAGQVVYADETIANYHPTYTVGNLTEGDKDIAFTGNLKVGDDNKIVDDKLSAGDAYNIEVTPDVTVERLSGKVSDIVNKPHELYEPVNGDNDWYKGLKSVTLVAPRGFLIKQTPAPATLVLRDAADADGYETELTFSDEGEHTIHYSLKRIGMADNKEYGGKSITYRLDSHAPTYNVSVSNTTATVKLTDAVSGLASCTYQWDGGAEQSVTGFTPGDKEATFTLTGYAGTHHLKLTLIDLAGNKLTEDNIEVTLEDPYVPPYEPPYNPGDDDDDEGEGDDDGDDPDPDPIDPVANEAIQAPAFGIYVYNGKLCLEAAEPCRVMIHSYNGTLQHIRQLPAGKTCLYDLPAGHYIVTLHAPSARLTQKVMVK